MGAGNAAIEFIDGRASRPPSFRRRTCKTSGAEGVKRAARLLANTFGDHVGPRPGPQVPPLLTCARLILLTPSMIFRNARVAASMPQAGTSCEVSMVV